MVATLLCGSVAGAETETQKGTSLNKTVVCTLDCIFSLGGLDVGTADTSWDGKKDYLVSTELYQKQNCFDDFHRIGASSGKKNAYFRGSVKGVWEFKSKHYTVKTDGTSKYQVLSLTDW